MSAYLLTDVLMVLLKALMAVTGLWLTLRLLDKSCGMSFKHDWLPKIKEGNIAAAIYLACRFVALGLLYGILFIVPI